jgi:hypothetical protein
MPALQRLFLKFPTEINRENISKNREIFHGNSELLGKRQTSISRGGRALGAAELGAVTGVQLFWRRTK